MAKYLNEVGLEYLVEKLLDNVGEQIEDAEITPVTTITSTSTHTEIPSAKAVYDTLVSQLAGITKLTAQVVTTLPGTGETNVIYLIETAPSSSVYNMFMWIAGSYASLGDTTIDLSGYWAKADLVALSNLEIQTIIDTVTGP